MSTQRVVWSEGLLMSPQHLQQADLYHEGLVRARLESLEPLSWGVVEFEFDATELAKGYVKLKRFAGVLPDGSPLRLPPGDPELPPARSVEGHFPNTAPRLAVYLALPEEREGVNNYADNGSAPVRYRVAKRAVHDLTAQGRVTDIEFAQRRPMLLFEDEPREGYVSIRLAELERDSAGGLVFVESYVPPVLHVGASRALRGWFAVLLRTMVARHQALSAARRQAGGGRVEFRAEDITRFLLLSTINGFLPVLKYLGETGDVSPRQAYMLLLQLRGQLSTFSTQVDAVQTPGFDYGDLRRTFGQLTRDLEELLRATETEHFISLTLKPSDDGYYYGQLEDNKLVACSRFVLAVKSPLPQAQIAGQLPQLSKIASWGDLPAIHSSAAPGVQIEWTHTPPPEIARKSGTVYFTIALDSVYWKHVISDRNIAIFVPPSLARELQVQLLGIPGAGA